MAHAPGCGGSACGVRPHVAYACGRRAARAFEATRGACFRVSASRGRVDIPDHTWSLFLELRPHVVSYPRARPRVVLCFLRPRVDVTDHVWLWGQRVRSSILELGHVWFFCFLRPRVDVIDHVWSSSPAGPRGPSRPPRPPRAPGVRPRVAHALGSLLLEATCGHFQTTVRVRVRVRPRVICSSQARPRVVFCFLRPRVTHAPGGRSARRSSAPLTPRGCHAWPKEKSESYTPRMVLPPCHAETQG